MNGAEFLHRFLHSVEKQKKLWIKISPWSDMVCSTGEKCKEKLRSQKTSEFGAASQIRTGDLILTKDALYRLSYSSRSYLCAAPDDFISILDTG